MFALSNDGGAWGTVARPEEAWMLTTRFTELLGCTVPIQQAPMGSFANPRLASAVANAGGQGMVTVTGAPAEVVAAKLDDALEQTPGPVGANFFIAVADPA